MENSFVPKKYLKVHEREEFNNYLTLINTMLDRFEGLGLHYEVTDISINYKSAGNKDDLLFIESSMKQLEGIFKNILNRTDHLSDNEISSVVTSDFDKDYFWCPYKITKKE